MKKNAPNTDILHDGGKKSNINEDIQSEEKDGEKLVPGADDNESIGFWDPTPNSDPSPDKKKTCAEDHIATTQLFRATNTKVNHLTNEVHP